MQRKLVDFGKDLEAYRSTHPRAGRLLNGRAVSRAAALSVIPFVFAQPEVGDRLVLVAAVAVLLGVPALALPIFAKAASAGREVPLPNRRHPERSRQRLYISLILAGLTMTCVLIAVATGDPWLVLVIPAAAFLAVAQTTITERRQRRALAYQAGSPAGQRGRLAVALASVEPRHPWVKAAAISGAMFLVLYLRGARSRSELLFCVSMAVLNFIAFGWLGQRRHERGLAECLASMPDDSTRSLGTPHGFSEGPRTRFLRRRSRGTKSANRATPRRRGPGPYA